MSLVDELQKLEQLRSSGSLSEPEFQQAKTQLLSSPREAEWNSTLDREEESLGRAANRYVSFQIFMGVIGIIIFLIFLFAVILPRFNNGPQFPSGPFQHVEWKR